MSERPIDVVLLRASEDDKAAAELADRLRKEGVEAWFVSSELRAGEDWRGKLDEALNGSSACAVLLGKGDRLSDPALRAVERRVARGSDFRVVVVLLPEAQWPTPSENGQEGSQALDEAGFAGPAAQKDGETEPGRPEESR
jgi:TIR domain